MDKLGHFQQVFFKSVENRKIKKFLYYTFIHYILYNMPCTIPEYKTEIPNLNSTLLTPATNIVLVNLGNAN